MNRDAGDFFLGKQFLPKERKQGQTISGNLKSIWLHMQEDDIGVYMYKCWYIIYVYDTYSRIIDITSTM